ncbi:SCO family protein [Variovorax robiniae]|uniref:SCO family protein n=1 Tax=Variovorax robiniae TaxID=1836199 RepID=A0ABU8X899_9BURK
MKRRALLRAGIAAALPALCIGKARAHNAAGEVRPPLLAPDIKVTSNTGSTARLRDLLTGKATALQLMFTGCSSICPIQGALFAQVQAALPRSDSSLQLLSASIDPLGDDPKALTAWLARFQAGSRWRAFSPAPALLDTWLDFLAGRAVGPDKHTGQVYFFDRQARLVLRTVDFPQPAEVARLLAQLATTTLR